jgi:hypothetical protein
VHDRLLDLTERVSVSSEGIEANNRSESSAISGNGRVVAFSSYATNLISRDNNYLCDLNDDGILDNCPDSFVHDRGARIEIFLPNVSSGS